MSSLLRYPAVSERIGLGRSAIYARIRDGRFPQPVPIGPRLIGWPETEVSAWLDATIRGATEDELRELVKAIHAKRGYKPNPERQASFGRLTSARMERRKERKEQESVG